MVSSIESDKFRSADGWARAGSFINDFLIARPRLRDEVHGNLFELNPLGGTMILLLLALLFAEGEEVGQVERVSIVWLTNGPVNPRAVGASRYVNTGISHKIHFFAPPSAPRVPVFVPLQYHLVDPRNPPLANSLVPR